uniref:Dehydrogenase/reductase SDR family member 6 n=2 Tax=Clastoptera arizonana TaxID=38151 RepID=A0A1B6DHX2_9HEMI
MVAVGLQGSIVNIASIAAEGMDMLCSYSLSKGAVKAFSRAVGKEMAQYGIRCNSISPGPIETTLLKPVSQDYGTALIANIPMKRFGKPQEVANLIKFLASEESSYINGTCVGIDGGL